MNISGITQSSIIVCLKESHASLLMIVHLIYFGSHHAIFHSLELAFVFPSGVPSFSQHIFSGLLLSTELSAGFLSMTDAILCLPKSTLCFIY